ncbi:cupin domain-containing protein [Flindersiella endophytica]
MSHDRFILLDPGQARPPSAGGRTPLPPSFAVKATTGDAEGRFSLLEVTIARPIPRHVHHQADEAIYVLEGDLGIDVDGTHHVAGKGAFTLLPHGVPHALSPASDPPPRVIQISSPGGWEHYLEDLFEAGTTVQTEDGRLDPHKINPIAAKYDITYDTNEEQS